MKSRVSNSLQFAWPLDKKYLWNEMKFTRDHARTVGGSRPGSAIGGLCVDAAFVWRGGTSFHRVFRQVGVHCALW